MFHKRLLKEFKENQKLVAGMVMTQWITLLANVVLVFALALFVSNLLQGQTQGKLLWIHAGTRHCKHSQPEIIISGIFECETQTA